MLSLFSSDEWECGRQGRRQLAYHFLPLALWQGGEREGLLEVLAFGNLQENKRAVELMEGDGKRDLLEVQRGF